MAYSLSTGAAPGGFGLFSGGNTGFSFSSLAASSGDKAAFGNKDSSKPFHWAGAGQKLFGQGGASAGDEGGEEGEVEQGDDVHFEPVSTFCCNPL